MSYVSSYPIIVIMGGPDVDSRISLMNQLKKGSNVQALGSDQSLTNKFNQAGFEYHFYPLHRGANPFADLQTYFKLRKIFQQQKPHIVHTFDTKPGVWGRLAARSAGVPVVIGTLPGLGSLYTDDSIKTRMLRQTIYQPLQKRACYTSDMTIFQNQDDASQFILSGLVPADKTTIIPGSGVDIDFYNPAHYSLDHRQQLLQKLSIQPDTIVITMISRLTQSKGVPQFFKAAQLITTQFPKVSFLLVGPEDQASSDCLTPSQMQQVNKYLNWVGSRQDIPLILASSDIFVLPTTYREGIPRVLLEAASMGLPLVATDVTGCREVVQDGVNGFLVPPYNQDVLNETLIRLIMDAKLRQRLGNNSRKIAVKHFDIDIIASQTDQLYWQLLKKKNIIRSEVSS